MPAIRSSAVSGIERRPTVALVTLGCRVNRAENEALSRTLEGMGAALSDPDAADVIIVNTCCVTGEAEAKTRQALRREAARPGVRQVIAYGCAAALFEPALSELGEKIVVVADRKAVAGATARALGSEGTLPAEGRRGHGALGRSRASLKIQDGCSRHCAFCLVRTARGPSRSMEADVAVAEVRSLAGEGFGEVVLCGVNLGCYDDAGVGLEGLLARLLAETDVGRLRLSSIEPQDVTDGLIDLMASSRGRIAPYLAMPLQSGSERTLSRMGRELSAEGYADRVRAARSKIPDVAIAADLICGFPGETDGDWAESLEFCRAMGFSNMHVFRYSPRPRTEASGLEGRVDARTAKARSKEARRLRDEMRGRYAASLVGSRQRVLVESEGFGVTGGLVRARVGGGAARGSLVDAIAKGLLGPSALDCS